jgi:hypothetical protein
MSKHQSCGACNSDFVGPDSGIGSNLCSECEAWIHGDCRAEIADLKADLATATNVANETDALVGELRAKLVEKDAAYLELDNERIQLQECRNEQDEELGRMHMLLKEKDAEIERYRNALREIVREDTDLIECVNDPDIATSEVVGDCAKIAKAALADTEGEHGE